MAFVPRKRMGPPPRSFAADAHDCIMVRVFGPTEYKVVARLIRAPERGLPSDRHPQKVGKIIGGARDWGGIFRDAGRFRSTETALSRISGGKAAESQRLFQR